MDSAAAYLIILFPFSIYIYAHGQGIKVTGCPDAAVIEVVDRRIVVFQRFSHYRRPDSRGIIYFLRFQSSNSKALMMLSLM